MSYDRWKTTEPDDSDGCVVAVCSSREGAEEVLEDIESNGGRATIEPGKGCRWRVIR